MERLKWPRLYLIIIMIDGAEPIKTQEAAADIWTSSLLGDRENQRPAHQIRLNVIELD